MNSAERIAWELLQIKAIKLQPHSLFSWASGILSPIYCDNRIALSHPSLRSLIADTLVDLCTPLEFDIVAGVATAGIPHATLVADRLGKPLCYIRSSAKSHGRENLIEGDLNQARSAVVIEDLISTGGSSIQAAQALEKMGIKISSVVSIFTYGFEEARDNFEKANIPTTSITNLTVLLEVARTNGLLDASEIEIVENWRKNYKNRNI